MTPSELSLLDPEERRLWEKFSRTVSWVGQEDKNGCVVAALAMIVGKPYAEVKAGLPPKDLSQSAFTAFTAESYLYEHGYTLQKKWKHICSADKDRYEWPIAPFAPVHYVQVVGAPTGNAHAVVMLENGDVLDPWAGSKPTRLTDYYAVNEIIGVWPEAARNLVKPLLSKVVRLRQYVQSLPANWHEDSSLETWFPLTALELERAKERIRVLEENLKSSYSHPAAAESRISTLTKEKDSALQLRDRYKERVGELRTKLIQVAAEVARGKYTVDIDDCKTIRHARARVQDADRLRVDLAQKLKTIADECVKGESHG